jgi:hypothetical protein
MPATIATQAPRYYHAELDSVSPQYVVPAHPVLASHSHALQHYPPTPLNYPHEIPVKEKKYMKSNRAEESKK